jgi:RNA polymerase sigma-70 factor (ECF subfamily)
MLQTTSAEDDQTLLLRRIAEKDLQATSEFYDQTAARLFAVALRILADPAEAEEVIQDVFVQIWDGAASFDPVLGSPFHWALGITRHRAIDRLRSRQRRARLSDQLRDGAVETAEPMAGPDSRALDAEKVRTVHQALSTLPNVQREAIDMAFFGGLTHAEIAEALKQPVGTIKARIRRGLAKLRENLDAAV